MQECQIWKEPALFVQARQKYHHHHTEEEHPDLKAPERLKKTHEFLQSFPKFDLLLFRHDNRRGIRLFSIFFHPARWFSFRSCVKAATTSGVESV